MKKLRLAVVVVLAALTGFCGTTAPAFAQDAPPPPQRPTPAEVAQALPPLPTPDNPSEWYGPHDLRTASIA
jgi:hypothetical protein